MIKAPYSEIPGGTVPKTAQYHCCQCIHHAPRQAEPTAAERNIDVVSDPQAERNMPALPELDRRTRQVWPIEVLGHRDAHHARKPDRHVAVSRKIEQDARSERGDEHPPPSAVLQ